MQRQNKIVLDMIHFLQTFSRSPPAPTPTPASERARAWSLKQPQRGSYSHWPVACAYRSPALSPSHCLQADLLNGFYASDEIN